ncbi:MAG: DUF1127 domain-containing protein [Paracoccaceae bacterium]
MAHIQTTGPIAFGARFSTRLTAAFSTLSLRNDLRATRKSLGQLSDHQLQDIGLLRSDINQITR